MDINPEDETFYTAQYHEAFPKFVENGYYAKHRRGPVNEHECLQRSNLIPSATASGSSQSSFDPYDLCSYDEEYITPNNVAAMTPGGTVCAACLLTATSLPSNSPPEALKNWGQINPNFYDYHSDPSEIWSTFLFPNITSWSRQQEKLRSMYNDLFNVARDIFSIIPHAVGVEANCSLG